jgi:hypothetical protein
MTLGCTRICWPCGTGREGFVGDVRLDEAHKEWNGSRRVGLDNACDDLPVRPWWKSVLSRGGCC